MRTGTCLRQAIAAAAVLCVFNDAMRADYVLYRDVVTADSPVAYWRLGESGSPFVSQVGAHSGSDAAHLVNTGISGPQAAAYLGFESGNQGIGVANTPGNVTANNYISVGHDATLNPGTGNWSVEAWIYVPSTSTPTADESWIVAKMGTTAGNYVRDGYALSFHFTTMRPSLTVRDSDSVYGEAVLGVSGPALATDTWHHLVGTLERGAGSSATVRMYVNSTAGSTVNSGSSSVLDKPLNSDKNLVIGSSSNGRYGFWGQIDEVAVYNYALTGSQVAAHFAAAEFDPSTLYWSGTGEWNTTNANWGVQSGTYSGTAWGVGVNDPVFEGTGGTVTITETLPTVRSLAFHADGYTVTGGTLRLAGEATVATAASVTARINSTVAGTASLTKTSAGTLVLGGPTTYTGDTTVDGGALILSSTSSNTFTTGNYYVNNGTLQIGESEISVMVFTNAARTITVNGGGTLSFINRNVFGAAPSIPTTTVVIDGGKVTSSTGSVGATNVLRNLTLRNGANLEVTRPLSPYATYNLKGTVTVEGTSPSAITLASGGTGWIGIGDSVSAGTVTTFDVADVTGDQAADLVVSASIRNGYNNGSLVSGLTKTGAGTMTLNAANTYTGPTTVSAGTLHVGAAGSLPAGLPVHVAEGAEYKVTLSLANFANVHSQLTSTASDALLLPAGVLGGEEAALGSTVAMAWRVRTGQEVAGNQLFSDVLSLSASLGTSNLPLYVLAMQYDDSLGDGVALGWWDTDSDAWLLATAGNSGNNASAAQLDYQGSFAAFQAEYGTTLADYVGAYGADPNQNQVWAVLNHASEFAVMVPEPSSLLLLGSACLGLLGLAGRRRNQKTWKPRG